MSEMLLFVVIFLFWLMLLFSQLQEVNFEIKCIGVPVSAFIQAILLP